MKKFLMASAVFISASTAAVAADIEAPPSVHDWSGFYMGLSAGAAWNNSSLDSDIDTDDFGPLADDLRDTIESDQTAFTLGALIGFNWQMDSLVFGVEADINYVDFNDSRDRDFIFDPDGLDLDASSRLSLQAEWFGTVRGRLGFAADNLLIYGTGGLAYGRVEADGRIDIDSIGDWDGEESSVNWGWTVGAGAEYAFNESMSIGAEYLYVDLGSAEFDFDNNSSLPDTNFGANVDLAFSVARATLKFKF